MSADELLTEDELFKLTGFEQPSAQQRALRDIGVRPIVKKDGHLSVTWEAIHRGMVASAGRAAEPNFGALGRAA